MRTMVMIPLESKYNRLFFPLEDKVLLQCVLEVSRGFCVHGHLILRIVVRAYMYIYTLAAKM